MGTALFVDPTVVTGYFEVSLFSFDRASVRAEVDVCCFRLFWTGDSGDD